MSDDDWQLPVPKLDPEARRLPSTAGGGGCPFTPGGDSERG